MTPMHNLVDYLTDSGPWEFPFEVQITEKAKTVVVQTPGQIEYIAGLAGDLSYPPVLRPEPQERTTIMLG